MQMLNRFFLKKRIYQVIAVVFSFLYFFALSHGNIAKAAISDCPTSVTASEPVDLMLVFDDSGSMRGEISDAQLAANAAVDTIFNVAPGSRVGILFLNEGHLAVGLTTNKTLVQTSINNSVAWGGTPLVERVNDAGIELAAATNKKVILFFTDGGFSNPGLSFDALNATRAGISLGSGANQAAVIKISGGPGITGDASLHRHAPTVADLEDMFNDLITTITTEGDPTLADVDGDGQLPVQCLNVLNNLCGQIVSGALIKCGDYFDSPSDWGTPATPALKALFATVIDDFDGDGFKLFDASIIGFGLNPLGLPLNQVDYYDFPVTFGKDLFAEVPGPDGTQKEWIVLFKEAGKDDLDADGEPVSMGRLSSFVLLAAYPNPGGKDWYDNPFTADVNTFSGTVQLDELTDTINDLDLDFYPLRTWLEKFNAPNFDPNNMQKLGAVWEPDDSDLNGCVYPEAREGSCIDCTASPKHEVTGRVPPSKDDAITPPDNKIVCQLEIWYEEDKANDPPHTIITSGLPDTSKPILAISAQCMDGLDNDLDGLLDFADPDCPNGEGGLVPCGRQRDSFITAYDESENCGFCHFFLLLKNVIDFIAKYAMPSLALLFFVVGGFLILVSSGNAEMFNRGRKFIAWAFIGSILILIGWLIVNTFLAAFGIAEWTGLDTWWKITCAG